ncbi:uncharacterized protein LOC131657712 [Vicia villosa]|uniref:uncharacterized protein LOC131657712 n=1 Tax=Vicia villosa TaxID=3911 RepID=UPI00273BE6A5|nr:uncharacterized protein LOC131657712 [Vicia villosa]
MIALEQCHYPSTSYITEYIAVLNFLMNTGRDVDKLVQKGILVNQLGDGDSVANLFNSLCKNSICDNLSSDNYILCEDLNAFYNDPWHKWEAILRRWKTAASVAGVFLLILSLLQSVCSVLQVVKQ